MKTPKEKAKELYNKFWDLNHSDTDVRNAINIEITKQCALICVDEIINQGGTMNVIEYKKNNFKNGDEYWREVKNEIEKL